MSRVPPWLKILLTAYFLQREMQTHTSWCLIVKTAEKKGEKKLSWFENNNSEERYKVKTWSNSIAKNNPVKKILLFRYIEIASFATKNWAYYCLFPRYPSRIF